MYLLILISNESWLRQDTFFVSSFRKLEKAGTQNTDLLAVISKREDTIHSNQLRLEEKTRECSLLSRKLEEALDDARHQVWNQQQRFFDKDKQNKKTGSVVLLVWSTI